MRCRGSGSTAACLGRTTRRGWWRSWLRRPLAPRFASRSVVRPHAFNRTPPSCTCHCDLNLLRPRRLPECFDVEVLAILGQHPPESCTLQPFDKAGVVESARVIRSRMTTEVRRVHKNEIGIVVSPFGELVPVPICDCDVKAVHDSMRRLNP